MAFGGIKKYHLIHLDFDKNVYRVFEYEKDRRFTANKAWEFIYHSEPILVKSLPNRATIETYYSIVEELGYIEKYCDRYMTFRCS